MYLHLPIFLPVIIEDMRTPVFPGREREQVFVGEQLIPEFLEELQGVGVELCGRLQLVAVQVQV